MNPTGTTQVNLIGQDRWKEYPIWRQANGKGRSGGRVSEGTIRDEMATLRSVMVYAAGKNYIKESQIFKGKLPLSKQRREEFTPANIAVHTYVGSGEKGHQAAIRLLSRRPLQFHSDHAQYRHAPVGTRNLQWRDIEHKTHRDGQKFVILKVRGKKKFRSLVAAESVGDYLERVRELSKAAKLDDNASPTGPERLRNRSTTISSSRCSRRRNF